MPHPSILPKSRLQGKCIFLSASIPTPERAKEFKRVEGAAERIEEAVVCCARAIFMEGGTLVFGAHPSISPLVARVVQHYYQPVPAEKRMNREWQEEDTRWNNPSVRMYQSEVWRPLWAAANEALSRYPLVKMIWTEAAKDESVAVSINDRPQAPRSMELMRRRMITENKLIAMVAIGGMEGVLEEATLFRRLSPDNPIFALETTGGAAAYLPTQDALLDQIKVPDRGVADAVSRFWSSQSVDNSSGLVSPARRQYIPYQHVAETIVSAILRDEE